GQPAAVRVDPEAGYPWHIAMPDVEHLPVWAQGQRGRPARHRHLTPWRQLTGRGIHRKHPYLVIILKGNVHVVWHGSTSSTCAQASCCLRHRIPLTTSQVHLDPFKSSSQGGIPLTAIPSRRVEPLCSGGAYGALLLAPVDRVPRLQILDFPRW